MIPATDTPVTTALPQDVQLRVEGLTKRYAVSSGGLLRRRREVLTAVAGIDLDVRHGETLGLVGESGSGKSTTGRCILRLVEPDEGRVLFRARPASGQDRGSEPVDLRTVPAGDLRRLRRHLQIVFQDPYASLNPRMTVADAIREPLVEHQIGDAAQREDRVRQLLGLVGLGPEHAHRYPQGFSGGQRQRVGIARALALDPSFLVLDEPVSSLDVSVQGQILNLFMDLQQRLGLTYLFIAHDLQVVRHVSDRVAVMYLGKVMELADRDALFGTPLHPYTVSLLSAIPVPNPRIERARRRIVLSGDVPVTTVSSQCRFASRCPIATQLCTEQEPPLQEVAPGHRVACHYPGALRTDGSRRPGA